MATIAQTITQAVLAAVQGGEMVATATVIAAPPEAPVPPGAQLLARLSGETLGSLGGGPREGAVVADCKDARRRHLLETYHYTREGQRREHVPRSLVASRAHYSVLIETFEPADTLLIVGGGHIGKALSQIGAL